MIFSGFFFAVGIDLDEIRPAGAFFSDSDGQKNSKKFSRIVSTENSWKISGGGSF